MSDHFLRIVSDTKLVFETGRWWIDLVADPNYSCKIECKVRSYEQGPLLDHNKEYEFSVSTLNGLVSGQCRLYSSIEDPRLPDDSSLERKSSFGYVYQLLATFD